MFKEPDKKIEKAADEGKDASGSAENSASGNADLEDDPYADIEPDFKVTASAKQPESSVPANEKEASEQNSEVEPIDLQDNFVENKEPAELMFCIILASIYLGLARYFWEPLKKVSWLFWEFEAFLIFVAIIALFLGARPYMSPSSLQISRHGIKYQGPYWPQRKTVNWTNVVQMYVSPELILVIYRLSDKPKSLRPLLIHSVYLADKDKIADSISKYAPMEPVLVANPGLITRTFQIMMFAAVVIWILSVLKN